MTDNLGAVMYKYVKSFESKAPELKKPYIFHMLINNYDNDLKAQADYKKNNALYLACEQR